MMHVPEKNRMRTGIFGSSEADGNNGYFTFLTDSKRTLFGLKHRIMVVIASDGMGWEHVSASFDDRCPTWEEMCRVKDLFWDPEDCVIQYHPPKSEYVNRHPYTLHLWRKAGKNLATPPKELIG
jgi:hypothetical protein